MALTTNDLQAIGSLIDQKLKKNLEQKFEEKLKPIHDDLQSHGKTLQYIKKKVNKMDKTLDIVARTYDARIAQNTKDIKRINNHLDLPNSY